MRPDTPLPTTTPMGRRVRPPTNLRRSRRSWSVLAVALVAQVLVVLDIAVANTASAPNPARRDQTNPRQTAHRMSGPFASASSLPLSRGCC